MNDSCVFMFLYSDKPTFLMTTLKESFEKEGITTGKCDIKMRDLGRLSTLPNIFIVDARLLLENAESRIYLCDTCIEKGRRLVIVGDGEEVDNVLKVVSAKIVLTSYKRPLNNREIVAELTERWQELKERGEHRRILVVDDSPMFLRTAAEWLEDDYNVSVCPSAMAAIHMIDSNRPDLILLDYEMPVCTGAQFLEMLHAEVSSQDIPVIFLTSRSDKETVQKLIALSPQGYLLKTLPKERILAAIKDFFERIM